MTKFENDELPADETIRRLNRIDDLLNTAFDLGPTDERSVRYRDIAAETIDQIPREDILHWKGKVPFYRALLLDAIYRCERDPYFHRQTQYGRWITALSFAANGSGNLVPYMLFHLRRGNPTPSEQVSRVSMFEAENAVNFDYMPPLLSAYWAAAKRP